MIATPAPRKSRRGRPRRRVKESQINVDIPDDLHGDVHAFCDRNGLKIKQVCEIALRRFLKDEKTRVAK